MDSSKIKKTNDNASLESILNSNDQQFEYDVSLLDLNTMRLGCTCSILINLSDESDVEAIVSNLYDLEYPVFILSGGSNVILPPTLQAAIIRPLLQGISVIHEDDSSIDIEVMAGENWHDLVTSTVNNGWYGLENLALIPGLVGASPVQNIGAYGVQLEDCVTHVKAFHLTTKTWHIFGKAECQFDYRDSKFKREAGQWLITRVGFRLHKDNAKINANYGDVSILAKSLAENDGRSEVLPADVMHAIIEIRQSKLPNPSELPNCGSFFKNPIISNTQFLTLKQNFPNIVGYALENDQTKVAAGWLIDKAGLKGQGVDPILTHAKQALVLVNHTPKLTNNPASQSDVFATQQLIQQTVFNTFSIQLEREPIWLDHHANYT